MKARNQRISSTRLRKQQHLLEVTVRADKARSIRNRTIVLFICKTIFFVSLVVGAWLGGKELLRRFVWENPEYILSDIRVSTDGALQRDQILQAGAVRAGVNIFKVDTEAVRAGIDKLPQVERAEIERIRPNRLDITITERHPIAWVTERSDEIPTASDKSWLIDARGVVMKTKRMLEVYYHLPHISGVAVANFVPGQRITTVEMQAALELVRLNTDNTRWQARNIDLAKGYCLIVTDQNHAKITFALDDIEQQFDRLFRYLDRADEEKKEIRTVNLLVRRNTPVTFQDANAPDEVVESTTPPAPVSPKAKEKEPAVVKAATPVPKAMPVSTPIPNPPKSKSDSRTTSRTKSTPSSSPIRKPFRQ